MLAAVPPLDNLDTLMAYVQETQEKSKEQNDKIVDAAAAATELQTQSKVTSCNAGATLH